MQQSRNKSYLQNVIGKHKSTPYNYEKKIQNHCNCFSTIRFDLLVCLHIIPFFPRQIKLYV